MEPGNSPENPIEFGLVVGLTAAELMIILATLEWHSQGEPGPDSNGKPITEPLGIAGREALDIESQLPEGWDAVDEDGYLDNATLHPVMFNTDPAEPMSRYLRFLLTNVYDTEE